MILTKKYNFTEKDIEKTFILKTWWAALVILAPVKKITLFFCNYTDIHPNVFTFVAFLVRLVVILGFSTGDPLLVGICGVLFQVAYLIDCMDGPIARLKKKTSTFGRYFDHLSDLLCGALAICALAYGQGAVWSFLTFGIIYIYFSEYYITLLVNLVMEKREDLSAQIKGIGKTSIVVKYLNYRSFFFKNNFKSFLSMPDVEAVMLTIFPLIGQPLLGLKIGFVLIFVTSSYKVLSSFVSIQTGEKIFP
ncbi:MAG TPA: CDP-alcohol phosphatidyltransferase family protein [Candidatus Omnitrophota bacterium]|nr:CDP-alcohol phosphatidyltransferase family protein [Candidatus Omnitrophota bacterium]HPS20368.1 CDP-alcohol phosphatidyltransferase family protein [Candidatus Omnitrophota bacterium]